MLTLVILGSEDGDCGSEDISCSLQMFLSKCFPYQDIFYNKNKQNKIKHNIKNGYREHLEMGIGFQAGKWYDGQIL